MLAELLAATAPRISRLETSSALNDDPSGDRSRMLAGQGIVPAAPWPKADIDLEGLQEG
jgi:hypothetical protein